MKVRIFACVLVLALLLSGCDVFSELGAFRDAMGQADRTEKYNAYVELLNFTTGHWFTNVVGMYFRDFGYEREPNTDVYFPNGQFMFGLREDGDNMYVQYTRQFELPRRLAGSEPDFGDADEKALELIEATEALMSILFVDINEYYNRGDHLLDNFARGFEYHTRMLEIYVAFHEAIEAFAIAFDVIISEFEWVDLEAFEEAGMYIHLYRLRIVRSARQIMDAFIGFEEQGFVVSDADIAEADRLMEELASDIAALSARVALYPDEDVWGAEGITANQANRTSHFFMSARLVEETATDVLDRVRAGASDGLDFHLRLFNQRYETLITHYNQSISLN